MLIAKHPPLRNEFGMAKQIQCAITTFVDNTINRVASEDLEEVEDKMVEMDSFIKDELLMIYVHRNVSKEPSIWQLSGKRSEAKKAELCTIGVHNIDDSLRYLGPHN